ncbi:MAG: phenylacetate--CoA ligase family protein [Planctomycetes bacterium]|nr:phenylacetate--CoA ligase family protein [Planctomycetota bacterium]
MKLAVSRKNLWNRLPRPMRSCMGPILGLLPRGLLFGGRFRRNLRFIERAQWWPRDKLRDYQLARLRDICTLAYEKTDYYRDLFDKAGFHPSDLRSIEDVRGIPTVSPADVRQHARRMCARAVSHPSVDLCATGGTGGQPLFFYMGRERSAIEYGYLLASWARVGYRLPMPLAVLRGRVVAPDSRGLYHEYDPILRHHYYSSFHMGDEDCRRYIDHIRTIGPCFLHVYPSTVTAMTRFIRRAGIEPPRNVRGIIAESEIVYPDQREMVEEVFGCRCFACYGQSEKVVIAAECEHSQDYHVWPTYGYFELLDEAGRPVTTPGQRGEIVGTGFINTVMPFIRYRTGDYATFVADRCEACGREHPVIRDIRGHRTQEVLVAADGSEIPWAALNMHDETFLHVRRFQFFQDTPGRAVLRIEPAEGFEEDVDGRRMLQNLGRKLNGQIALRLEVTDNITLTPRGKAIYVDQRIDGAGRRPATAADGR